MLGVLSNRTSSFEARLRVFSQLSLWTRAWVYTCRYVRLYKFVFSYARVYVFGLGATGTDKQ